MSSVNSSPISNLNHDILTWIFYLNTHIPETEYGYGFPPIHVSALHTARHTSQVCRSWRQLILQSPTIWANSIDLMTLNKANEPWFKEVLKRTGKAKLSIYGQVGNDFVLEMVSSLIDENWHRVRRLDIIIFEGDTDSMYPEYDSFWEIFWERQAPSLEIFTLKVDNESYFERRKGPGLFAGSAPLLRRLHSPIFPFDHRAPWVSQLVSVTMSDPFTFTDALNVLANTPLLESLVITSDTLYDEESQNWTRRIYLPNLRRIEVSSNIVGSHTLLAHIAPRSGCALRLKIKEDPDDFQISDLLQPLAKLILCYAEGFLIAHQTTKLAINIDTISVRISTNRGDGVYFGLSELYIDVGSVGWHRPLDSACANLLLSTFTPTTLPTVHDLRFGIFLRSYSPTKELSDVLRSFSSVKKMTLRAHAFDTLNILSDSASLFPHLAEVTMDDSRQEIDLVQLLRGFLTKCKEAGHPVHKLYLPYDVGRHIIEESGFLQEFEGLEIGVSKDDYDSDL